MYTRKIEKLRKLNALFTVTGVIGFLICVVAVIPAVITKDIFAIRTIAMYMAFIAVWLFISLILSLYVLNLQLKEQYEQNSALLKKKKNPQDIPPAHPNCGCIIHRPVVRTTKSTFLLLNSDMKRNKANMATHEDLYVTLHFKGYGVTEDFSSDTIIKTISNAVDKLNYT